MTLNLKDKRGIVLIVVCLVSMILLIFSVIFINRTINEKNMSIRQKNIALAFYLAEAGLDRGLVWLREQTTPPGGTAAFDPLGAQQALGDGTYSISIDPDDNNTSTFPIMRYRITSTGRVADVTKTLVNEVQTDTFARYSWFTDSERFGRGVSYAGGLPLWFLPGDRIEGPVRTNGNFFIKNNPVFTGSVQSSEDFITFFNNGTYVNLSETSNPPNDQPEFQGGMEFGVEPPLELGRRTIYLWEAARRAGGIWFDGTTTVILNGDGTMDVTNRRARLDNQNMPLPSNGALYVRNGDLITNGTLNGQLTMGTNRDVIINNNVVYADDPRINPNSDDVLGLIAERDVVISRDAPYDLEIDASIMALYSSFMIENWYSMDSPKGKLTVYGSIVQRERGPVGSMMTRGEGTAPEEERLSGYKKDYYYDPRFSTLSPPYFPTTGDYISLSWKE